LDDATLADRREQFLTVAAAVFAKRGYRETDVQEIAHVAGVSKATIYRYFPTKLDLFRSTIEQGMANMHRSIDEAMAMAPTPLGQLRAAVRAYLAYWDAHPDLAELMVQERADFRGQQSERCLAERTEIHNDASVLFGALIAQGLVRNIPTARLTDAIFHLLYGTMFFNRLLGRSKPLDEQVDDLLDIFFNGSLTPAGRDALAKEPA
jgi:AcrR family transcriptional regulator